MTFLRIGLLTAALTLAWQAHAQDAYRNDISFGGGSTVNATGQTNLNLPGTTPDLTVAYGYRFWRWLQADAALDTAIHPVGSLGGGFGPSTPATIFSPLSSGCVL